ncbi:GntR family transcriptional regulator [Streptomyces longispororuber]|uniref:GntR family transcriptional regulator n=1 Tax=Streptomyces longispororuber TaxID=68230 RepID=A0A919DMT7_9ACTN|nr:GntR family transcriptional regulator [Streptomyces longispororuber]
MGVSTDQASVNERGRPAGPPRGSAGERRAHCSHREVADELRARIRSGTLRPGQRMPTQAELASEFGVERGAVRRALRILQGEHLLANVSKGSPATVAAPAVASPDAVRPQPTMVGLAPRIAAAFQARHVEIDALCLTSISLTMAIGEPLRQIHAGRLKPAKVAVRVLLPSRDIALAFPAAVGGGDEGAHVHRRWLDQRNAQGQVLRHNLLTLRGTHGIDVSVEFRALPFTPPVKLYLLNGSEALFAYYTLAKRGEEFGQEYLELWDAQGTQSTLFPFHQGDGPRDTTFVEQSHLWFDALWNTISEDLRLNAGS